MEVSRLTFTKEFKEKTMKKMSNVEKNKVRLEMLREAEADGRMSQAHTRLELSKLAGFTDQQYSMGVGWVYRNVKTKAITEVITGYDKKNRAIYEYHLANKSIISPRVEKPKEENKQEIAGKVYDVPTNDTAKIVMTAPNGVIVTFENVTSDIANKVIETVINMAGQANGRAL